MISPNTDAETTAPIIMGLSNGISDKLNLPNTLFNFYWVKIIQPELKTLWPFSVFYVFSMLNPSSHPFS